MCAAGNPIRFLVITWVSLSLILAPFVIADEFTASSSTDGAGLNSKTDERDWKQTAVRVLQVIGVGTGVALITTILAPLPFYLCLWISGFFDHPRFKKSENVEENGHVESDGSMWMFLPHGCSLMRWGHPILYLGLGALIGVPIGVWAGWYFWQFD